MDWWQKRGASLRLEDQAAADCRASACSGVHYSFEKLDRVTCSTVHGRLELLIAPTFWQNQLVSFGVDEDVLQSARMCISGTSELSQASDAVVMPSQILRLRHRHKQRQTPSLQPG